VDAASFEVEHERMAFAVVDSLDGDPSARSDGSLIPPLQCLFGAEGARTFLEQSWPGRAPFGHHGALDRLPAFLRSGDMQSLRDLCAAYCGEVYIAGGSGKHFRQISVSRADPWEFLTMGFTVFLPEIREHVERSNPHTKDWIEQLSFDLGLPARVCGVGAFASPGEGAGLDAHYDTDDGFLIQLEGTKQVELAPPTIAFPSDPKYGIREPALEAYPPFVDGFPSRGAVLDAPVRVAMQPGSVLYIPMGWWHRTSCDSLSSGVKIAWLPPRPYEHLIDILRLYLLQDPRWRRPMYGAWGHRKNLASEVQRVQELVAALPGVLGALPLEQVLDRWQDGHFPVAPSGKTLFQRVPSTSVKSVTGEQGVTLHIETYGELNVTDMDVAAHLDGVASWLVASSHTFSLQSVAERFPEVNNKSIQELVLALVDAGAIRRLPYARWPAEAR
jgi:50S ribosomal protein L16 3-hydroxylase